MGHVPSANGGGNLYSVVYRTRRVVEVQQLSDLVRIGSCLKMFAFEMIGRVTDRAM